MFIEKKTLIISLISVLAVWIACLIVGYNLASPSFQMKYSDVFGTYQFDLQDIDNTLYLAVMPTSEGDTNKDEGQFQLYNIDNKILAQGTCIIKKEGFVTFYSEGKSISTMLFNGEKYYFVDNLLEPQEITKIGKEPMVSSSLE